MSKQSTKFKVLSIITAILLALSIAGCLHVLIEKAGTYFMISAVVEGVAIIFAILYYIFGFKKNAALFYQLFMLFYAFTYLAEMLVSALDYNNLGVESIVPATVVFSMIMYGNTLILAIGKDLGKKVSYALCGINILFYALPIVGTFVPDIVTFSNDMVKQSSITLYGIWLVMAINALVMTIGKYADKAERGSK